MTYLKTLVKKSFPDETAEHWNVSNPDDKNFENSVMVEVTLDKGVFRTLTYHSHLSMLGTDDVAAMVKIIRHYDPTFLREES